MDFFLEIISLLWFIRTIKFVLFWIFLWQLKNYHIGRFIDHFKTHHGKKIFLNTFYLVKFPLVVLIFINSIFIYLVLLVYLAEVAIFALQIFKKRVKVPVITFKALLLTLVSLVLVMGYGYLQYTYRWSVNTLVLFDIYVPLIISLVVLAIQPFFVMVRTSILQKARKKIAQFKKVTVIGITGSYGKTSTKEFLTTILSAKFNVLSTPDHKNSEIGISQTILNDLQEKHEVFIVEMGAYQKGGIKLLCDIVKPHIGVVTGVNQQHLATFGSLENLLSAEGGRELVNSLPNDGVIILNGDNTYCLDLYKKIYQYRGGDFKKRVYTLIKNKISADIWTEDIAIHKESITFIARSYQKELAHFNLKVLGKHHVQNALGAMLVAKELGMTFEEIMQACKNITQSQAGMTLQSGVHGIKIIDSSYSSNPDGVMADLDYVGIFNGKRVIVMPCLIELGNISGKVHHEIGRKIAKVCDLAIITTRDQFEKIKKGAVENGMSANSIIFSENPKEIFHTITTFCKEGDAVLLEGRVPSEIITLLHGK